MGEHRIEIGVVVARKALAHPWAEEAWLPYAVLPAAPAVAPWTPLGARAGYTLFYAGACELALHSGATAHYRDNLGAGRPSLWVMLTPEGGACRVAAVTADPYEGEALTEGVANVVEAVPMPDDVRREIAAFVDAFHVERPFFKRERDHADADSLGTHPARTRRGGDQ